MICYYSYNFATVISSLKNTSREEGILCNLIISIFYLFLIYLNSFHWLGVDTVNL